MGLFKKLVGVLSRKINRFNIENRAHKVLERDKPIPAPKFQSNLQDLEFAKKVAPDFISKQSVKDSALDDRLKKVFVTSQEPKLQYEPQIQTLSEDDRPLPTNNQAVGFFEFGYVEPVKISPGRCSLRQANQFILDHYQNPELWSADKIAQEYKMKVETVENILKYFKTFAVHLPKKPEEVLADSKAKKFLGRGKS